MWGLGRIFDVSTGIVPVDLAAGTNTGHRIHMRNYETLAVLFVKGAASAGTDTVTLALQEHTLGAAGSSQNLSVIHTYYRKNEATLDGDETWTEVTQAAAHTIALAGASFAAEQVMLVFEVEAASLSAGYEWLSVNIADPGAGGTITGTVLYIPHGLKIQRRPDLLAQPNA